MRAGEAFYILALDLWGKVREKAGEFLPHMCAVASVMERGDVVKWLGGCTIRGFRFRG